VPVFLLVLLAMLEFGFMFLHHLTLEYATREGARAGAAMANGSVKDQQCGTGGTLGAASVDPLIIAAVQRVLESPGSQVDVANIQEIDIYKANASGEQIGSPNVWYPKNATTGTTYNIPCQTPVTGLDFKEQSVGWAASGRQNGPTPDSLGVAITYTYQFRTPMGGILRLIRGGSPAWAQITMTDRTVMALEPTN